MRVNDMPEAARPISAIALPKTLPALVCVVGLIGFGCDDANRDEGGEQSTATREASATAARPADESGAARESDRSPAETRTDSGARADRGERARAGADAHPAREPDAGLDAAAPRAADAAVRHAADANSAAHAGDASRALDASDASDDHDDDDDDDDAGTRPTEPEASVSAGLIAFTPMYSAYDGVHAYQLTASVSRAAQGGDRDASADPADPIDAATVKWMFDPDYLEAAPFPDIAGAVLLTTRRSGTTMLTVSATTEAGLRVQGEAPVVITPVTAAEWEAGRARYDEGHRVLWRRPNMDPDAPGVCGLSSTVELPPTSACASCHGPESDPELSLRYTPTQTAGYSDDTLIALFTRGDMPDDLVLRSPLMSQTEMPVCLFYALHTWEMTEEERRGVVAQLRAIPPRVLALDEPVP